MSNETFLNNSTIKSKLINGEFKIANKRGRSKVWNVFAKILNDSGQELSDIVVCRECYNVYKHNSKCTSNLVKHKCYINNSRDSANISLTEVDNESKKISVQVFTEWCLENCRPFKIVEDSGLKKVASYFVSIGSKFGKNVEINSALPHPTTISRNINKIYQSCFNKVTSEIVEIKKVGFSLTTDLWTDNYLRQSFLALTIHYVKDGNLFERLLGMKSMMGEKCTSANIILKIKSLLNEFQCNLENAIIVTDRGSNMKAAFRDYNHLFCIAHLINNAVQKSIADVDAVEDLCDACAKLVKYCKKSGLNSTFKTSLKSFCPTRWNTMYTLLLSIERNWADILKTLQERNESHRISNININHVSSIVNIFEPFEEAFKALQGETYSTLHLVIVHIHRLKKKCAFDIGDADIVSKLKDKLSLNIDTIVTKNLTIFHKIALFLFPPANKLIQFDEDEKNLTKTECKLIMETFVSSDNDIEEQVDTIPTCANISDAVFADFVTMAENITQPERVEREIEQYEKVQILLTDNFNVLQWWYQYKDEFPLLYKTSCKILPTPASSSSSERTFSLARNLITDKRCSIASNDNSVNQIMFVNSNMSRADLQNELINT